MLLNLIFRWFQTNASKVLIAINPYKTIPNLYGYEMIESIRKENFLLTPPHVYSISKQLFMLQFLLEFIHIHF